MVFMPMGFKINISRKANFDRIDSGKGYLPEDIPLLESFRILENGKAKNEFDLSPEDYRNFINWLGKGPQQPIPDVVLRILCHYKSVVKKATNDVNTTDGMRLKQTNLIKTIEELIKGGDDNKDAELMCLEGGATERTNATTTGTVSDNCCEELKDGISRLAEIVETKMESDDGKTLKELLEAIKANDLRSQLLKLLGSTNGSAPPGEVSNTDFQTNVQAKLKLIEDALTHPVSEINVLKSIIEKGFTDLTALIEGLKNTGEPNSKPRSSTKTISTEPQSPGSDVGTPGTNATNIKSLVDSLNSKIAELSGILSVLKPVEGSPEEFKSLQTYLKTKFDSVITAVQSIAIPAPDFTQLEQKINGLFSTMVKSITDHITTVSKGVGNPELIELLTELKGKSGLGEADIQRLETIINQLPKPPHDVSKNVAEIKELLKASPPVSLEAIRQLIQTQPALKEADKEAIRALLKELPLQQDYTQILQEILAKPASPTVDTIKAAVTADLTQGILADMRSDIAEGMDGLKRSIEMANKNMQSILDRKTSKVDLAALGDKAVAKFAEAEREVEEALRKLKEMNSDAASLNAMEDLERNVIKLQMAAKLHAEQAEELYALNSNISSASAEGVVERPPKNVLQVAPSEQSAPPEQSAPLEQSAPPEPRPSAPPLPQVDTQGQVQEATTSLSSVTGLPPGWAKAGPDEEGHYWYVNQTTGESTWNKPMAGGASKNNTRRRKKEAVNDSLSKLNNEMNGFRRKISLKRKSNLQKWQLSEGRRMGALWQSKLAEFRDKLATCEAELARLKQSVSSASTMSEYDGTEATKLMEKITQLKKIIAKVIGEGKENAQFEPLVNTHMKAFQDLTAENDALKKAVGDLTAECTGKDARIKGLETELLTQKATYGQLQAQLAGAGTNATTISELRGKLAECERKQAEITGQKATLEHEVADLRVRLVEAGAKLAELEKLKAVIKAKVTGDVPDNMIEHGINAHLRNNQAEFIRLEDEKARQVAEVSRLTGLMTQKEGEITRLNTALAMAPSVADKASLERQLTECRDAYARLKVERDAIDDMNRQITMELESYRKNDTTNDTSQESYPLTARSAAKVSRPVKQTSPSYMRSTATSKGRMDVSQGQLNQLYGKGAKGATWVNYNARAQKTHGGRLTLKGARLAKL